MGMGDHCHTTTLLTPGKRPNTHFIGVWVEPKDGWGNFAPITIRYADRPACSELLYQLKHLAYMRVCVYIHTHTHMYTERFLLMCQRQSSKCSLTAPEHVITGIHDVTVAVQHSCSIRPFEGQSFRVLTLEMCKLSCAICSFCSPRASVDRTTACAL